MAQRAIGTQTAEALDLAARLPDLLMSARQISTSVAHGLHGRRRPGSGETFWQFRRFRSGEPARNIDWRRSARDNLLYVREREWEAAHTVWLWSDLTASMDYRSALAPTRKRDRAITLMLALSDLVVRSGERVGLTGLMMPTARRQAAELLANALAIAPARAMTSLPDVTRTARFSDLVVFGDFLDPVADITRWIERAAGNGLRGHLVQIVDPAEEVFPFDGRTEFIDPEVGAPVVFGRAASAREAFLHRMKTRRQALREQLAHVGWSLLVHHTDQPPARALMALHNQLSRPQDSNLDAYRPARPRHDETVT